MSETFTFILAQDDIGAPSAIEGGSPAPTADGQTTTQAPQDPTPTGGPARPQGGMQDMVLPLVLVVGIALMFIFSWKSQRKEKQRRAEMLGGVKKGDRIQTVGGIIGSVVEVKDDEIVLKVDENANTRIRFAREAVRNVIESKGAA